MKKRKWLILFVFIIPAAGCAKKKPPPEIPPRPVRVAAAARQDVPIYIRSFGNLVSPENVDIVSQIEGKIREAHFQEGDPVERGTLLFSLDPVKYRAARDQAAAELALSRVDLKLKEKTLRRNRELYARRLISEQDFDTYYSAVEEANARVRLNGAALREAAADLDYCSIRSPITGITGKRLVDPGNVVPAETGPTLVNIRRIDPLYADFTVPETDLDSVRKAQAKGELRVLIFPRDGEAAPAEGRLKLIDNTVSNTTGTIALRAEVPNPEKAFWPGEFVKIKLIVAVLRRQVTVPEPAVLLGQKGKYLYALGPGGKAELRLKPEADDDEQIRRSE
jgi:multidrug efflux system membrane fusion protein